MGCGSRQGAWRPGKSGGLIAQLVRAYGRLRGYGATAARLTPDQKVGSSNLSGLISFADAAVMQGFLLLVALLLPLPWQRDWSKVARPITSWNKPVSG